MKWNQIMKPNHGFKSWNQIMVSNHETKSWFQNMKPNHGFNTVRISVVPTVGGLESRKHSPRCPGPNNSLSPCCSNFCVGHLERGARKHWPNSGDRGARIGPIQGKHWPVWPNSAVAFVRFGPIQRSSYWPKQCAFHEYVGYVWYQESKSWNQITKPNHETKSRNQITKPNHETRSWNETKSWNPIMKWNQITKPNHEIFYFPPNHDKS